MTTTWSMKLILSQNTMIFWLTIQQKPKLVGYCPKISKGTKFINTESSKTNEPDKLILYLLQRLYLKSSSKHVFFQNLSVYCTWKNIRQQCKSNTLKIIVPTLMMSLNHLATLIQCQIFNIISSISWKGRSITH